MKRSHTISDVAKAAGVAQSTVSRVLNGGYASAEVERKVRAAIDRLDYAPSAAARNLKLNRTGIIGLVTPSSQGQWLTLLLGGIEAALSHHGASVVLCSLELDGHYSDQPVRDWIEDQRVDGIIFVRPTRREAPLVKFAREQEMPHVHVVPDQHFRGSVRFSPDNLMAGKLAAEHLLDLGHRDVAFVGATKSSVDSNARLEGLRSALAEHGLSLSSEHTLFTRGYEVASGRKAAERFLHDATFRSATAVVLASDDMALGFMNAVQRAGLSIPGDVSVVGFDDIPAAELVWPGLTTVAQPVLRMGYDATARLLESDSGEEEPDHHYPSMLVARQSTGSPRLQSR